jgi:hypothetical protein
MNIERTPWRKNLEGGTHDVMRKIMPPTLLSK